MHRILHKALHGTASLTSLVLDLGIATPAVVAEMNTICTTGLAEGMIVQGKMVTGIRTDMGVNPEAEKGSLIGSICDHASRPAHRGRRVQERGQSPSVSTPAGTITPKTTNPKVVF